MGIMAYRGQVVEGAGLAARRLMGNIGDRTTLGTLVTMNDWNEYTGHRARRNVHSNREQAVDGSDSG